MFSSRYIEHRKTQAPGASAFCVHLFAAKCSAHNVCLVFAEVIAFQ